MHIYINIGTNEKEINTEKKKKLTPEQKEKIKKAVKAGYGKLRVASGRLYSVIEDKIFDGRCFFSEIKEEIMEDVAAVRERDPAARSDIEVMLLYSGVHAMLAYRVAHKLYVNKKFLPARAVSQLARFLTGIEIHPGAQIGKRLMIDHGSGVVIGETAEVHKGVVMYQGVTLGGTGKEKGKRHPTIMENVVLSAGAKVLGGFTVGKGAKIGAGAVVLKEVPPYATVVGIPGRIVRIRLPEEEAIHRGITGIEALSHEAKEEQAKAAALAAEEERNKKK